MLKILKSTSEWSQVYSWFKHDFPRVVPTTGEVESEAVTRFNLKNFKQEGSNFIKTEILAGMNSSSGWVSGLDFSQGNF